MGGVTRLTTPIYVGKVCPTHPELKGERYRSSSTCPACVRVRHRKKRQDPQWRDQDLHRQRARSQTSAFRERARADRLRRLYGLDPEDFQRILRSQAGRCAVCGTTTPAGKGWHVDHDHETGTVRGVLCTRCNCLLGHAKDSVTTLRSAIAYLTEKPAAIKVMRGLK